MFDSFNYLINSILFKMNGFHIPANHIGFAGMFSFILTEFAGVVVEIP